MIRGLILSMLAAASLASALPIELKDQNGTRYNINTAVDPLIANSNASGALTDATYTKGVTVTSYYLGLTPFGFFLTTYTTQREVNVPLTNAFAGFNGRLITGIGGPAQIDRTGRDVRQRGRAARAAAVSTRAVSADQPASARTEAKSPFSSGVAIVAACE